MSQNKLDTRVLGGVRGLLTEVGDLKRVRVAHREGSLAEQTFRRSWTALSSGQEPAAIALRETSAACAAARLGGIDENVLNRGGLDDAAALDILSESFDEVTGGLPEPLREHLRGALGTREAVEAVGTDEPTPVPSFVGALARQPRAGATRPGTPRLILDPQESHADHCATVAVYATLLSGFFDADPGTVFLAGLSHHLHNALLPDSGFAADTILGEHATTLQQNFAGEALEELPDALRERVEETLSAVVGRVDNPEARAFQAADALDRVLQMEYYARAAAFTLDQALDDLDLVHPGPEQDFHLEVLSGAGLR